MYGLKFNFFNYSILKGNICIKLFEIKFYLNWRNDSIYLYLGIYRYISIYRKNERFLKMEKIEGIYVDEMYLKLILI